MSGIDNRCLRSFSPFLTDCCASYYHMDLSVVVRQLWMCQCRKRGGCRNETVMLTDESLQLTSHSKVRRWSDPGQELCQNTDVAVYIGRNSRTGVMSVLMQNAERHSVKRWRHLCSLVEHPRFVPQTSRSNVTVAWYRRGLGDVFDNPHNQWAQLSSVQLICSRIKDREFSILTNDALRTFKNAAVRGQRRWSFLMKVLSSRLASSNGVRLPAVSRIFLR